MEWKEGKEEGGPYSLSRGTLVAMLTLSLHRPVPRSFQDPSLPSMTCNFARTWCRVSSPSSPVTTVRKKQKRRGKSDLVASEDIWFLPAEGTEEDGQLTVFRRDLRRRIPTLRLLARLSTLLGRSLRISVLAALLVLGRSR